jgi:flagellar motility protein MotE (MotC chaperone)
MELFMRSSCALIICGVVALADGSSGAATAQSRPAAAPLDIAAVARNPAPARRQATKPRRKVDARLPQTGTGAGVLIRAASPTVAIAPKPEPEDITGAVGSKRASKPGKNGASQGAPSANAGDGTQFCTNISDAAADARLAWQMKELEKTEASLRERIAELEAKRAEYEKWLKLRQDFLKKAEDNVVGIYSRMRPDAAAAQIASMQDETAAAVLAKLNVRSSSAILNEMEPARAAHLANTLSGLRDTDSEKSAK